MIISIGAGCFVTSFVFMLWEQQGFVPVNTYPVKLLLGLNFHLQIIQMWKEPKAYIPNWQNWQLLFIFIFFPGQSDNFTIENILKNKILGAHQTIFEQTKYFEQPFCS